jgi:hypothetical protein
MEIVIKKTYIFTVEEAINIIKKKLKEEEKEGDFDVLIEGVNFSSAQSTQNEIDLNQNLFLFLTQNCNRSFNKAKYALMNEMPAWEKEDQLNVFNEESKLIDLLNTRFVNLVKKWHYGKTSHAHLLKVFTELGIDVKKYPIGM